MDKRIYEHRCRTCNTNFYVEDAKLIGVADCPKCTKLSAFVGEHKLEQTKKDTKLTIRLDLDTLTFERKLKAISKHTESLAEELKEINNLRVCDSCGSVMDKVSAYHGGELEKVGYSCPDCCK